MRQFDWVVLIASCIFFYFGWGMWFHHKMQKYLKKRCKIPEYDVSSYDVEEEAKRVRNFIINRAHDVNDDADDTHHIALREHGRWKVLHDWDGWMYLKSLLWLCYELGIGIEFFTFNDKPDQDYIDEHPERFDHVTFKEPPGFISSFILLLLSGGALLSIIAFVLLWVC